MEYSPVKIGLKLHIPINKSYYKNFTFSSSAFVFAMLEADDTTYQEFSSAHVFLTYRQTYL